MIPMISGRFNNIIIFYTFIKQLSFFLIFNNVDCTYLKLSTWFIQLKQNSETLYENYFKTKLMQLIATWKGIKYGYGFIKYTSSKPMNIK